MILKTKNETLSESQWQSLFNYPHPSPETRVSYLNSGSMSLSPTSVINKIQNLRNEYEQNPTNGLFLAWPRMWQVQKDLAQFFKSPAQNLFMRTNVTYVMNDFLMALQLPAGSEILTSDLEYGAIVKICEYKAKIQNHSFRMFSFYDKGTPADQVSEDTLLERLERSLSPKTKLVMLSHVMTGCGLRIPIEKIAKLLRQKNIFFAVDGAHGPGSNDLSFENTAVDFYGSNLHKWIMGPKGTGFGYLAPHMREHLQPQFAGWTTGEPPDHLKIFGEGDQWTSRWMINSTHQFADFYAVSDALNFWQETGREQIFKRQQHLGQYAAHKIEEKTGWKCLSLFKPEIRGPLMAFALPEKITNLGFPFLFHLQKEHRLVVSMVVLQGSWCLRVSPNVYNTENEIDQAAKILASFA